MARRMNRNVPVRCRVGEKAEAQRLSLTYDHDCMDKRIIDLSDIKSDELDKTASFTDLMSRSERKRTC